MYIKKNLSIGRVYNLIHHLSPEKPLTYCSDLLFGRRSQSKESKLKGGEDELSSNSG